MAEPNYNHVVNWLHNFFDIKITNHAKINIFFYKNMCIRLHNFLLTTQGVEVLAPPLAATMPHSILALRRRRSCSRAAAHGTAGVEDAGPDLGGVPRLGGLEDAQDGAREVADAGVVGEGGRDEGLLLEEKRKSGVVGRS